VHKSAAGTGKLPAAVRTFVLIPAGDGVIPGAAAADAGKAPGPADLEKRVFTGLFVHGTNYILKIGLILSCNNLTKIKMSKNFVFFHQISAKKLKFHCFFHI
jgi:hypothetical protein